MFIYCRYIVLLLEYTSNINIQDVHIYVLYIGIIFTEYSYVLLLPQVRTDKSSIRGERPDIIYMIHIYYYYTNHGSPTLDIAVRYICTTITIADCRTLLYTAVGKGQQS